MEIHCFVEQDGNLKVETSALHAQFNSHRADSGACERSGTGPAHEMMIKDLLVCVIRVTSVGGGSGAKLASNEPTVEQYRTGR